MAKCPCCGEEMTIAEFGAPFCPKCDGKEPVAERGSLNPAVSGLKIEGGVLVGCAKDLAGDLIIPDGVTSIGERAFFGCTALTSIAVPRSVTRIGTAAFNWCRGLKSLTVAIGNGVYHSAGDCLIETASGTLIRGCKNSVIPADGSVGVIGDHAFAVCEGLESVVIPDGVTRIGAEAFHGCTSLREVVIPGSVTDIGWDAFRGCTSLASVTIPSGVTSIGSGAFSGCRALAAIDIPGSVTSIERDAFYDCRALRSVNIADIEEWLATDLGSPSSCPMSRGAELYVDGALVTDLVISDGVTSIGDYAFYGCDSLASVTTPDSVASIGKHAFGSCGALASAAVGKGVTSMGYCAFAGCDQLKNLTVAEGNSRYHSAGNCIIETASKTLIAGCTASVIPTDGSVTTIGYSAFEDCTSLTSITIPGCVKRIESEAFYFCRSLASVVYGGTTEEWRAIEKGTEWDRDCPFKEVKCSDGTVVV